MEGLAVQRSQLCFTFSYELKKNSNLIEPCDWLVQEDITLLHKISWAFHETYQSNLANVCQACNKVLITVKGEYLVIIPG